MQYSKKHNAIGTVCIVTIVLLLATTDYVQQFATFTSSFSIGQHLMVGVGIGGIRFIYGFLSGLFSVIFGHNSFIEGLDVFVLSWYDCVALPMLYWVVMSLLCLFFIGTINQ